MAIERVNISLSQDVPVNRLETSLEVGNESDTNKGIDKVQVIFNGHYNVEIKQNKNGEIIVVITSGGVSKEIDLSTFHQLITMNY